MFENGKTYLNLGQYGLKHPGSWILTIWVVILALIIGQNISGLIIISSAMINGDVPAEILRVSAQNGNQDILAMSLTALSAISAIPFLITYIYSNKFATWGILGLLSIAGAIAGLVILSGAASTEATIAAKEILMRAIAASPVNYAILLLSFWPPFLALLFATRIVHKRTARSVITAATGRVCVYFPPVGYGTSGLPA